MKLEGEHIPIRDLGELHTTLRKFRAQSNKAMLGKCLAWHEECPRQPDKSHSISRSWLTSVADETNHVVNFRIAVENAGKRPVVVEPSRIGIHDATVFRGFCQKHDSAIFSCLENEDFVASEKQLACLVYRSVCHEALKKYHRVSSEVDLGMVKEIPTPFGIRTVAEMVRCVDLLAGKQALENMFDSAQFSRLASCVIEFARAPTLLVSSTFHPLATFAGRCLEVRQEWVTLSIFPSRTGGFAVFTWNKNAPKNTSLLVKSLRRLPRHLWTTCLIYLVMEASENFVMSPAWWESLPTAGKNNLLRRFARNFTMGNDLPPDGVLKPGIMEVTNWEPTKLILC